MNRRILATIATVAAFLMPAIPASAAPLVLSGSYTVSANDNPAVGLAVETANDLGSPVDSQTNTFASVTVPNPGVHFVDLFQIFALESTPFSGNDFDPQTITVLFNFTGPNAASGTITGTTAATADDLAELQWNGPLTLIFENRVVLTITLANAEFGDAFNGVINAELVAAVPEPGTLALFGVGLLGLWARGRRVAA